MQQDSFITVICNGVAPLEWKNHTKLLFIVCCKRKIGNYVQNMNFLHTIKFKLGLFRNSYQFHLLCMNFACIYDMKKALWLHGLIIFYDFFECVCD